MADDRDARRALSSAAHTRGQADLAHATVARLEAKLAAAAGQDAADLEAKVAEARRSADAAEAAAVVAEAAAAALGDVGPFEPGPVVIAHAQVAEGKGVAQG